MNNAFITGPAASGKSELARTFASERPTILTFDHTAVEISIDDVTRSNPEALVIILDECSPCVLQDSLPVLVELVGQGARAIVIAKTFAGIPVSLIMPFMRGGGLRDIAMTTLTTEEHFDRHRQLQSAAPPRSLARNELYAA
ncbi:hypothetical protein [Paraburkholderia sp. SIMBA_054]|uniref:hypothetical protein n=1 Tax=Paraburkholderia sp. SIMBA_054 TaxID=3085795 RepID=UPI0039794C8F